MANNRATTRICEKKLFIVIECKILTTHKKSKETSLLAGQKHATFFTLVWTVNEKLKILGENGENQSQKCFKSQRPQVTKGFDCSKIMFTLPCSVQLEKTDCRKLAVFPWATTTLLFWQTNSYGCSRGLRLILPVLKLLDRTSLFFVPSECLSPKICCSWSSDNFAKRAHCVFFFFRLYFSCLLDQDLRSQRR